MRSVNLKALSALLLAMVASLAITNLYLYNRNYYGPGPPLLRASSRILLQGSSWTEQGLGVNLRGERKMLMVDSKEDVKSPLNLRLLKAQTKNSSQRNDSIPSYSSSQHNHTLSSSSQLQHNHTHSNSSRLQHNHTLSSSSQLQHNHTLFNSSRLQHNHTLSSSSWLQHNHTLSNSSWPQHNHTPSLMSKRANTSASSGTHRMKTQFLHGYLAALKIYEQQTMATGNLMQLQCFASKLNISIVQPFMKDSLLSLPLDQTQHSQMLHMEELYDMQEWTTHTEKEGYTPLVTWEEFIRHAPRGVVLVQMKYPLLKQVKNQLPHTHTEVRGYKKGCGYKFLDKAMDGLKKYGFTVARKVCYNFLSGDEIPLEDYKNELIREQNILGNNVTVIIDEWRGLGEHQRVLVKEKICPDSAQYRRWTQASPGVGRDATLYVDKFLGSTTKYLAVIARYEMTVLAIHMERRKGSTIPFCLQETLRHMSSMRKRYPELGNTFLSIDIGKYGSKSFAGHGYYGCLKDMEAFVGDAYQGGMNISQWERSFESVVKGRDAGYMAKVQQAIVARAQCVLFVGGGTFQQNTLHLYQQLHPDPAKRCVHVVKKCTSPYRPVQ